MKTAAPTTASGPTGQDARGTLDRWFEITKRGSTWGREARGGLVTFFAMAYIIALNPAIIGTVPDINGNLITGQPVTDANIAVSKAAVAAATALIAGVMTILMGVVGRYPLALAAGLGLNALLAYTLAPIMTWPQAMGLVVLEGVLIAILVLTGFRTAVFKAVPAFMRAAISVGIGLFVTFVGLVDGGLIRPAQGTPVTLGINGSLMGWPIAIFLIGLIMGSVLYARGVRGGLLISIIVATVIAVIVQVVHPVATMTSGSVTGWKANPPVWGQWAAPDLQLLGNVDVFGAFTQQNLSILGVTLLVFSLLLADFFDTMGTVVAVGAEGHLLDGNGNPPHLTGVLMIDSLAAVAGGLGSTSSNTSYVESVSGVAEGARTGVASVVTGLCFLVAIVASPIVSLIPAEAVSPVLVIVGALMMSNVTEIKWSKMEQAIPAFLTIVFMPFAYSITVGIGIGFIMLVVMDIAKGKVRQIHPLMWLVSALFVLYFLQGLIGQYT
ncbi:putative MFS transporter, AGZA family, xanthine/uracil permease [Raineyella antarctica]|uniref:Putative MFS transporter, AGZA family, xanthine/uracil permease n=1 Tax=Raineyella antarctica TaxID=1577474 RepID=A0A1G6GED9_9ACTN|nr:NCS2 family permease [Raineyella antarctica]SDB80324.1 putative MFS transporter, AGZA family, xanthine/uracil permease [Raineyella antarctica]